LKKYIFRFWSVIASNQNTPPLNWWKVTDEKHNRKIRSEWGKLGLNHPASFEPLNVEHFKPRTHHILGGLVWRNGWC